jgi:hypothetical protein
MRGGDLEHIGAIFGEWRALAEPASTPVRSSTRIPESG